jgi:hypothetical protein
MVIFCINPIILCVNYPIYEIINDNIIVFLYVRGRRLRFILIKVARLDYVDTFTSLKNRCCKHIIELIGYRAALLLQQET